MTIDEVIAQARSDEEFFRRKVETDCVTGRTYLHPFCEYIKRAEEQKHLAELLEELNLLRLHNHLGRDEAFNAGRKQGYNNAIDDFVKLVHKHDWNIRNRNENSFIYGAIDTLAEQLKAGGDNDD